MKRASSFVLALATLGGLAWVATPMALIRPFGAQTSVGLAVAFTLRRWGTSSTLLLLVLGLAAAVRLWPALSSWIGRLFTGLAVLALAGCALLARANYFEWMFRPLPRPGFAESSRASHVAEDDLVLGVQVGTEAHAYPVRAMAYHHLVNDVIDGEPIVATY